MWLPTAAADAMMGCTEKCSEQVRLLMKRLSSGRGRRPKNSRVHACMRGGVVTGGGSCSTWCVLLLRLAGGPVINAGGVVYGGEQRIGKRARQAVQSSCSSLAGVLIHI